MYHYYPLLHQNNELCPCNNEFIFTHYNLLLHVVAYCCISAANTMCDVLTGPRSRLRPAHHIYWIPQMMMFWSPTRLSQKPCGAVDLRCSSATMDSDGSTRRDCAQGPAGCEQERKHSGLHLFFILLFQMHMRDSLHQIDYGVIIHILQAILCLFYGKNM